MTLDSTDVSVLLNTGGGTFTSAPGAPFSPGSNPGFPAIGDLNGNRRPDLAVANHPNNFSVLLNNG